MVSVKIDRPHVLEVVCYSCALRFFIEVIDGGIIVCPSCEFLYEVKEP